MSIIYEALKKMSRRDVELPATSAEVKPEGNGAASASRSHKPEGNACLPVRQGAASDSRSHKPGAKMKIALALVGTTVGIIITWLVMNKPVAQLTDHRESFSRSFPSPSSHPDPAKAGEGSYPVVRLNNPEAPAAVEELPVQVAPELILNGIVLSADGNLALINEEILQVGDEIGRAKVEEITDKQVILTFQNQEIILKKK